jgi:hypothetical protein
MDCRLARATHDDDGPCRRDVFASDVKEPDVKESEGCAPAFSRRKTPEACGRFTLLRNEEGAGNAGCRSHPWAPCNKKHGGRTTGTAGAFQHSLRDGFTAYFVLSPVTGLFCHRRLSREKVRAKDLAPASGRQDHTTSPSASESIRRVLRLRPPHPTATFVTIAIRPSFG